MQKNKKVFIWQGGSKGGTETIMLEIAKFIFNNFGLKPVLGVFKGEKNKLIDFEQIEIPRLFPKKLVAYNTIAASLLLGKKLNDFDLVLTHSGGFWKRKNNFFVYREPGDLDLLLKSLPLKSRIIYLIPYLIALYSIKTSDYPVAASFKATDFFRRHKINNFLLTSNFTDIDRLPINRKHRYRANNVFNLVFIGRNDKLKNLSLAIQAVKKLGRKFKLHVFGFSGYSTSQIIYHGWQKESVIHKFIAQQAQLLVLPSLFEASPIVLLESLILGLPAVCSINALPDEYKETVPTFNDLANLIKKIKNIRQNYDEFAGIFNNYAKELRNKYGINTVLESEFKNIFKTMKNEK